MYLSVCEGELPCHIGQVTLLWVALYSHVSVILHFGWMRPVLVTLGLQNHNSKQWLGWVRVISQDIISLLFETKPVYCTRGDLRGIGNSSGAGCEVIVMCVHAHLNKRKMSRHFTKISEKRTINQSFRLPSNSHDTRKRTLFIQDLDNDASLYTFVNQLNRKQITVAQTT